MIEESLMQPLKEDRFSFACHKTLPCFTKCCAKLSLVLTPYDVLRLKDRLNLLSRDFLEKYTTSDTDEAYGIPIVKLRMNQGEEGRCPFLSPDGCTVYDDRPGACRIYPLGRAASKIHERHRSGEYYFVVKEHHCLGFNEDRQWAVQEWIKDQGLEEYNTMNDYFLDIIAGKTAVSIKALGEKQLRMFYMACYSLDDFRRFIFESTFLSRFEIEQDVIGRIETDDIELMKFGSRWLKFSLFGEKTVASKHMKNNLPTR